MANQNSKKYSEQDYIEKCNTLGLIYIGHHKHETKSDTMIDFQCPKHLKKGMISADWGHFKNAKRGCPYCTGRYRTTEEFQELIDPSIKVLGEYSRSETPIDVECSVCHHKWSAIPRNLMNPRLKRTHTSGCPICGKNHAHNTRRKPHDVFCSDLAKINPDIEVIGQYNGTHRLIRCRCKKCGSEWESYPANLLNLSAGCHMCHLSEGERRLIYALKKNNVNIDTQHTITGLSNVKKLRFDAYDIDRNIAFEFNGEQHYYPVDWGNRGGTYADDEFKLNQYRDSLKKEFCEQNNIQLVIIPYWDINNIDTIITDFYKNIA